MDVLTEVRKSEGKRVVAEPRENIWNLDAAEGVLVVDTVQTSESAPKLKEELVAAVGINCCKELSVPPMEAAIVDVAHELLHDDRVVGDGFR